MTDLRFPIGDFAPPRERITRAQLDGWIDEIDRLPADLRDAVARLSDAQLDTRYRPGGWTLRQVVHHLADSHLNSVLRFKWALTEERPTIKTYEEADWAELPDTVNAPIDLSLDLLDALHRRWVVLLRAMTDEQMKRMFDHPENGPTKLDVNVAIYAWHGRHHLAHVTTTIEREGF